MTQTTILHIDMDAFFAAVEMRDNPELRGKPVIIGALPHQRGVVSTCSYEARKFGIHSAMNIKDAYRCCPHGVYLRPDGKKYAKVSAQIREILLTFTDIAEFVALDEGYLDVTHTMHLFGGAINIAQEIKRRIRKELELTCSVGIGYNMMTAKLASEEKKPDGLFAIMDQETFDKLILNRPVGVIYGIGKKTKEMLKKHGIVTVKDLRNVNLQVLRSLFGSHGIDMYHLCRGIDHRKVTPNEEAKSIGREETYQEDTADYDVIRGTLVDMIKELSFTLKEKEKWCRTVTLKIKYADMTSVTRSKTVENPVNDTKTLYDIAEELLSKIDRNRYVRLVGLSVGNLTDQCFEQLTLDMSGTTVGKKAKLLDTIHTLRKKYGVDIIKENIEFKKNKI